MPRLFIACFLLLNVIITTCSISCNDKTDNFLARDLTITPSVIESGKTVLIEFYIDNKGYRDLLSSWTLEINGEKVNEKTISAEGRDTTRGYFTVTANDTGNHTVRVYDTENEQLNSWFLVTETEDNVSRD